VRLAELPWRSDFRAKACCRLSAFSARGQRGREVGTRPRTGCTWYMVYLYHTGAVVSRQTATKYRQVQAATGGVRTFNFCRRQRAQASTTRLVGVVVLWARASSPRACIPSRAREAFGAGQRRRNRGRLRWRARLDGAEGRMSSTGSASDVHGCGYLLVIPSRPPGGASAAPHIPPLLCLLPSLLSDATSGGADMDPFRSLTPNADGLPTLRKTSSLSLGRRDPVVTHTPRRIVSCDGRLSTGARPSSIAAG